jgi:hypothetical protein
MVDLRTHLRKASRARWSKASEQQKKESAANASRSYWDSLSSEERSAEMKRRAVVRAKNAEMKRRAAKRKKKKT